MRVMPEVVNLTAYSVMCGKGAGVLFLDMGLTHAPTTSWPDQSIMQVS